MNPNADTLSGSQESTGGRRSSRWAFAWILIAATAGVFLAGGPRQGSLGIFLVLSGIALVVIPPRQRLPWTLWAAAGAVVLSGALAFLPASLLPTPEWRRAFEAPGVILLPRTVTPVPWETGFWLAVLAISLAAGLYLLANPIRSRPLLTLVTAASSAAALYSALAIYARLSGWNYPFDGGAEFGFFPNRNHTATLLMTGALMALGPLGVAQRHKHWAARAGATASLALCLLGLLFFCTSRGAILCTAGGGAIWLAGLGKTHRNRSVALYFAGFLLAIVVFFLTVGNAARDRVLGLAGFGPKTTVAAAPAGGAESGLKENLGARTGIYRDALTMIRDSPLTGAGLGSFRYTFDPYRERSLAGGKAYHPESDWLMLMAEAGIPAIIALAALLWTAARALRGQASHPYWPLRWACLVAAGAALAHAAVDVPVHRVALGWWIVAVAALGLQIRTAGGRSSVQRALFVLFGVGGIALGGQLVRAEWFGGSPLPPFAADVAAKEILAAYSPKAAKASLDRARRAVDETPLNDSLRYQLGALMFHFDEIPDTEIDRVFLAQRTLSPVWPQTSIQQGQAWMFFDNDRAAALWADAVRRQDRIFRRAQGTSALDLYRDLVGRARECPPLQELLYGQANGRPDYVLAWMENARPELVPAKLAQAVSSDNALTQFNAKQRTRFLQLWKARDAEALKAFLQIHPDWNAAAADSGAR